MAKAKSEKSKTIEGFGGQKVEVPFEVKVKRNLQLPVLKFTDETPVYVRINDAMSVSDTANVGENAKGKEARGQKMKEPATVVHCDNLIDKQQYTLICSAVIKANLARSYPDDSYVGKCFQLIRHAKREGKPYFDYTIAEIEDPSK